MNVVLNIKDGKKIELTEDQFGELKEFFKKLSDNTIHYYPSITYPPAINPTWGSGTYTSTS